MKLPTAKRVAASAGCLVLAAILFCIPTFLVAGARAPFDAIAAWSALFLIYVSVPAFFGIAVGLIFGRTVGGLAGVALTGWLVYSIHWSEVSRFW